MNLLSVNWDIRALWIILPLLSKICLTFLFTVVLFTIIMILTGILRVNSSEHLARFGYRLANLRQLQTFAFYFFGACLADHLFAATKAIERSTMSLQAEGIDAFGPMAWFAFIGFLTLLFSHALQWWCAPGNPLDAPNNPLHQQPSSRLATLRSNAPTFQARLSDLQNSPRQLTSWTLHIS